MTDELYERIKNDTIFDGIYGEMDHFLYDELGWAKFIKEQTKKQRSVTYLFQRVIDNLIIRGEQYGYTEEQEEQLALFFTLNILNCTNDPKTHYKIENRFIKNDTQELWREFHDCALTVTSNPDCETEVLFMEQDAVKIFVNYLEADGWKGPALQRELVPLVRNSFVMHLDDSAIISVPSDMFQTN